MKTLIILHGWGSSKEKWQAVKKELEKEGIKLEIPDLPGFKKELPLERGWALNDYVEWLKEFCSQKLYQKEIEEPFFLLGHSFGGSIAIKFALLYPQKLKGLILVSAAGIRRKPSLLAKALQKIGALLKMTRVEEIPLLKEVVFLFKKIFYRYILRKTDYFEAEGKLKETMKNILREDLTPLLKRISVPTLILWGQKDKITPLEDGFLMAKEIKTSQIKVLENIAHAPHLENASLLASRIKKFINSFN